MGMRARWLWRHSEGSREGPMSSNPARPTGESNPVAWPPSQRQGTGRGALLQACTACEAIAHASTAKKWPQRDLSASWRICSAEVPWVPISAVNLVLSPACGSKNLCHRVEDPVHRLYI